jgi:predicted DNA-binding protein (MmcQ/YjbR family)
MAARNRLTAAETALRRHALSYPETHEEFPWGDRALKVKGKIFVIMHRNAEVFILALKLPISGKTALGLTFASPTAYGLGKSGWVSARFSPGDEVPVEMIKEWIDESYRAVAPKKLVAQLEGDGECLDDNAAPGKSAKKKGARR